MKFTFKTTREKGRYASFYPNHHDIKLKGIRVGSIDDKRPHKICLMVMKKDINEDGNPNCNWKNITLKNESETLQEAKDFLNKNIDLIMSKYTLKISE